MNRVQRIARTHGIVTLVLLAVLTSLTGCGPTYREVRMEAQRAMLRGDYSPARYLFLEADELERNHADNLHDLGFCSIMIAKERFDQMNKTAAMRELDRGIAYYTRAIDAHPGHQAAIVGKTAALELKGQPDLALKQAEWAARVVGPAARQYLFLASELEERGDMDAAFFRYRQSVRLEPRNPRPHIAFAKFLLKHGNEAAGVQHLKHAFTLDPHNAWVRDELATRGELPSSASPATNPP